MNDKLSPKEIAELHEVAEWLDSVYTRLDGSIFAFALELGNEEYHRLLQTDIERVIELGISMNRSMENCGCLFEFLNGTERPPIEFILRARSEINNLAIAVRNLANDEQSIDDEANEEFEQAIKLWNNNPKMIKQELELEILKANSNHLSFFNSVKNYSDKRYGKKHLRKGNRGSPRLERE